MDWIELAQDTDRWRGVCGRGDEHSSSMKVGEFFDCLQTSSLIMNYSAPWNE